VKFYVKISSGC